MSMNEYMIQYLPGADVDDEREWATAHRVEGWSEDYAFFGHPHRPGEVTDLVPRRLVGKVTMVRDTDFADLSDLRMRHQSLRRQALGFYSAAQEIGQKLGRDVYAVVGSGHVHLEEETPDGMRRSESRHRSSFTADEVGEVVAELMSGPWADADERGKSP